MDLSDEDCDLPNDDCDGANEYAETWQIGAASEALITKIVQDNIAEMVRNVEAATFSFMEDEATFFLRFKDGLEDYIQLIKLTPDMLKSIILRAAANDPPHCRDEYLRALERWRRAVDDTVSAIREM